MSTSPKKQMSLNTALTRQTLSNSFLGSKWKRTSSTQRAQLFKMTIHSSSLAFLRIHTTCLSTEGSLSTLSPYSRRTQTRSMLQYTSVRAIPRGFTRGQCKVSWSMQEISVVWLRSWSSWEGWSLASWSNESSWRPSPQQPTRSSSIRRTSQR